MPCYRPLRAFQCADGAVVFYERKKFNIVRNLDLACGRCDGCRLERSRQWAIRCMHEAQMHDENCFVTLTYDNKHIPHGGTLVHRDFQLFMKRLREERRRQKQTEIRFYMAGEYGEQTSRPHYHACLFGVDFHQDRSYWRKTETGHTIYKSPTLDRAWQLGEATIGELTFESAAYCARYIMKKAYGDDAPDRYIKIDTTTGEIIELQPEYARMSNQNGGIGAPWIDQYQDDVYPEGKVVVRGHLSKPPKYYDLRFKKRNPDAWETLAYQREQEAKPRAHHNTNERLEARAKVARAKIKQLKRKL